MRNSFEDMKRFIAEQDDLIMDTADRQHEKTAHKVINGPRPQPLGTPRVPPRATFDDQDESSKRRNVFQRALRGLSAKNNGDLQNVESMLMRLLGEVEGLRATQDGPGTNSRMRMNSLNSFDNENAREATDPGYEPEGQAGTSSTGDRSGFFSNNSSRQADRRGAAAGHRDSTNRVSTVMEGDEDPDGGRPQEQVNGFNGARSIPAVEDTRLGDGRERRGSSVPLGTPPRNREAVEDRAFSNENTPQMSTEGKGHRKHKSTSSSFHPKMISRWSKTTASSIVDNFRGSGFAAGKSRPYSQGSQSDSNFDVGEHDDEGHPVGSYMNQAYGDQENRPPSPLMPSQVSENPKYHAHRNSMNLQHPQPRVGPTGRFQHHLENEAQTYSGEHLSPTSQTSSSWGQHAGAAAANRGGQQRYSGYSGNERLSPISDGGYSETSSAMMDIGQVEYDQSTRNRRSANSIGSGNGSGLGQHRSDLSRNDEPLVPQRPPKIPMSPTGGRQANYVDHVNAARAGSPALDKV
jgi:hypothetical protein